MDYEKFVEELVDGQVGDIARERLVNEICDELAHYTDRFTYETDEARERDRAWADCTAEWLRDNYL